MNTAEPAPAKVGKAVATALLLGLSLSLLLSACSKASSSRLDSAKAIRLLDFSCDAGETERIEPWGRSGASRGCYRDDRSNGRVIFWEEGYVNLAGSYREDMKDGTWTVFNGDGSVFVEIVFDNGVKVSKTYH